MLKLYCYHVYNLEIKTKQNTATCYNRVIGVQNFVFQLNILVEKLTEVLIGYFIDTLCQCDNVIEFVYNIMHWLNIAFGSLTLAAQFEHTHTVHKLMNEILHNLLYWASACVLSSFIVK